MNNIVRSDRSLAANPRKAPLKTPSPLNDRAATDISAGMNGTLADVFALYFKTKNFHWHMSGPHFRDYHLMLDEQALQLYAMTDPMAERIRKLGGNTLRSIGHVARTQRVLDNDASAARATRARRLGQGQLAQGGERVHALFQHREPLPGLQARHVDRSRELMHTAHIGIGSQHVGAQWECRGGLVHRGSTRSSASTSASTRIGLVT